MQKKWTLKTEIPNQQILKVRTGCNVCVSIFHLINQCAYKQRIAPKYLVIYLNVWLRNSINSSFLYERANSLIGEAFNKCILDSGFINTVCSESWLQYYLDSLNKEELNVITVNLSRNDVKFGDSKPVQSLKPVKILAVISDKSFFITTGVVPFDVPLLLNKEYEKS